MHDDRSAIRRPSIETRPSSGGTSRCRAPPIRAMTCSTNVHHEGRNRMKNQYFRMMCAAVIGKLHGHRGRRDRGARPTAGPDHDDRRRARHRSRTERSVRVPTDDLNLAALRGEQTLHRRVKGAARSVCAPNDDHSVNRPFTHMRAAAWNGALPQIDLRGEAGARDRRQRHEQHSDGRDRGGRRSLNSQPAVRPQTRGARHAGRSTR